MIEESLCNMSIAKPRSIFLDLRVRVCVGGIIIITYFKETDRNRLMDTSSCYSAGLESVNKRQFLRLKINCINHTDFLQEAESLKQRFLEKGYDCVELDRALKIADERNREHMLVPRENGCFHLWVDFFDQIFHSTLRS